MLSYLIDVRHLHDNVVVLYRIFAVVSDCGALSLLLLLLLSASSLSLKSDICVSAI